MPNKTIGHGLPTRRCCQQCTKRLELHAKLIIAYVPRALPTCFVETDEQHSAACSVLADRRNVTPPEVLKPTQPLAGPVPSTMVQASSTTHNTSVVPSALFGSARNCTINRHQFRSSGE